MKKIFKDKRVILAVAVIILVVLFLNFNQRMVLLSKLRGQQKQLTQEVAQLEATRSALQTEIAYAQSDDAVEEWAREEASMIQEGDIPIVLLPPAEPAPTQIDQTEEVVDEVKKWEIWWELFFGH
jgi:cell division protein FtsB